MITAKKDRWLGFSGEVTEEKVATLCKEVLELEKKEPGEPITLFITSGGGQIDAGFAFYDFVTKVLKPNLQTIAIGQASSISVPMFLAGNDRIVTQNTTLFLHEFGRRYKDTRLSLNELRSASEGSSVGQKAYARIVSERSGRKISAKKVEEFMRTETTITAREAVEMGLAQEILK